MSGARGAFVRAVAAAALVQAALCSGAHAASDPRAVAARVAHALPVQDRLPSEDDADTAAQPPDARTRGAPPPARAPATFSVEGGGAMLAVLGWTALGLIVIFAAVTLFDVLANRRAPLERDEQRAPPDGARAPRAELRATLTSAEQLAAEGRYTEAMHQLLADTLAVLRQRLRGDIPDALTSREILQRLRLEAVERNALRDMILRVERTWFARRDAGAGDYDAVRASFQVFARSGAASA